MDLFLVLFILASISIFIFSLHSLTEEIAFLVRDKIKNRLLKIKGRIYPILAGFLGTALIQSSNAFSALTISLTAASAISLTQAIGLIIGANIGTTVTAQLISLKLFFIGPILLILGFLLSFSKKYSIFAKAIFFFGLLLFSLELLSNQLKTVDSGSLLGYANSPLNSILIGIAMTVLLQSSSVVSSLIVIAASTGGIAPFYAVLMVLGANIGTTSAAFLASFKSEKHGKAVAYFHIVYNVTGVLLIAPFAWYFYEFVASFSGSPERIVANAHTMFNVFTAIIFAILLPYFDKLLRKMTKIEENEIKLEAVFLGNVEGIDERMKQIDAQLKDFLGHLSELSTKISESADQEINQNLEQVINRYKTYSEYIYSETADYISITAKPKMSRVSAVNLSNYARANAISFKIYENLCNIYESLDKGKMSSSEKYYVAKCMGIINECFETFPKFVSKEQAKEYRDRIYKVIDYYYSYMIKSYEGEHKGQDNYMLKIMGEMESMAPKLVSLAYVYSKIKKE